MRKKTWICHKKEMLTTTWNQSLGTSTRTLAFGATTMDRWNSSSTWMKQIQGWLSSVEQSSTTLRLVSAASRAARTCSTSRTPAGSGAKMGSCACSRWCTRTPPSASCLVSFPTSPTKMTKLSSCSFACSQPPLGRGQSCSTRRLAVTKGNMEWLLLLQKLMKQMKLLVRNLHLVAPLIEAPKWIMYCLLN